MFLPERQYEQSRKRQGTGQIEPCAAVRSGPVLDEACNIGSDEPAEVAEGVDEAYGARGRGAGKERCRVGPPDAEGSVRSDRGERDEEEGHPRLFHEHAHPHPHSADEQADRAVPAQVLRLFRKRLTRNVGIYQLCAGILRCKKGVKLLTFIKKWFIFTHAAISSR